MKDPLQTRSCPYEILGLERRVGGAEINSAFKRAFVKHRGAAKVAFDQLSRPNERAKADLFMYDPAAMEGWDPNPAYDPAALSLQRRAETAAKWEAQLRHTFPELSRVHGLGVLHYWWAVHEDERLLKLAEAGPLPVEAAPPVRERWREALAYWSLLLSSDRFWDERQIPRELAAEVRRALRAELEHGLAEKSRAHAELGARSGNPAAGEALARAYADLAGQWTTELHCAEALAASEFRVRGIDLTCGQLLLSKYDLLEKARERVESDLRRQPTNEILRALRIMLSPHAAIATRIELRQFDAALDALEALDRATWEQAEVQRLRAAALTQRARQHAELNRIEKALTDWEQALRALEAAGAAEAEREELRAEIVGVCMEKASAYRDDQEEKAQVLQNAFGVTQSPRLTEALGELLRTRAIALFNAAYDREKIEDLTPELVAQYEQSLALLKRAVNYDSARAKEDLQYIAETVANKKETLQAPRPARQLSRLALDALNRNRTAEAVALMRMALERCGAAPLAAYKDQLVKLLVAQARELGNEVINQLNAETRNKNAAIDAFLAGGRLAASALGLRACHQCGTTYLEGGSSFTFNDGRHYLFCVGCSGKFQALNAPVAASREMKARIQDAKGLAQEAAELVPEHADAKQCRTWLDENFKDVQAPGEKGFVEGGFSATDIPAAEVGGPAFLALLGIGGALYFGYQQMIEFRPEGMLAAYAGAALLATWVAYVKGYGVLFGLPVSVLISPPLAWVAWLAAPDRAFLRTLRKRERERAEEERKRIREAAAVGLSKEEAARRATSGERGAKLRALGDERLEAKEYGLAADSFELAAHYHGEAQDVAAQALALYYAAYALQPDQNPNGAWAAAAERYRQAAKLYAGTPDRLMEGRSKSQLAVSLIEGATAKMTPEARELFAEAVRLKRAAGDEESAKASEAWIASSPAP
ncbi:MAG: hypothetical protein M5U26_19840 [Planctomycetota bacterium]|nr:hypothetical protein [Planctomycetota bacterium]